MLQDYTKTDRFLLLIQTICKAPRLSLSEAKVKDILGNPSRSQYHKLINELLSDVNARKAILMKKKDDEGNITFQLNECEWVHYLEGSSEIHFILKSYKEMGHLFPQINFEGVSVHSEILIAAFIIFSSQKQKTAIR